MGDPIRHPERLGGALCTPAPLCNRDPVGTGHLSALGDGTQAGITFISGVQPRDQPHPTRLEQGKGPSRLGERDKQKNKGATPSPSPRALLWTLQIRFSEKEMFYRP